MVRKLLAVSLVFIASLALGGTFPTDGGTGSGGVVYGEGRSWYCVTVVDGTITAGDIISPIVANGVTGFVAAGANQDLLLMTPGDPRNQWILEGFSITVTSALTTASNEDCLLSLGTAARGGGAVTSHLEIAAGQGTSLGNDVGGACETSLLTGGTAGVVDGVGDYCVQILATPVVATAGHGIVFEINPDTGPTTCSAFSGANLCVLAQAVPTGNH